MDSKKRLLKRIENFARTFEIDLDKAGLAKMTKNGIKYPTALNCGGRIVKRRGH